jgi:hypothetical protein
VKSGDFESGRARQRSWAAKVEWHGDLPVFFRARWNYGFVVFLYFLPMEKNMKDLSELIDCTSPF